MNAVKNFVADYCAEHGLGWQEAVAELQKLWPDSADLDGGPSSSSDDDDNLIWPPD